MMHYFISDDSFFLLGLSESICHDLDRVAVHHANEPHHLFLPHPGDIVVIAINNIQLRKCFFNQHDMSHCRMIILQDMPISPRTNTHSPWLLAKNTDINTFISVLKIAQKAYVSGVPVSVRTMTIFEQLGSGESMINLAMGSRKVMQIMNREKREIMKIYGLYHCNALAILLCQDILRSNAIII